MLRLNQFSRPARTTIALLWIVGVVGSLIFAVGAVVGYSRPLSGAVQVSYTCLFVAPAALVLLRALLVREERLAWAAFGAGMVCFGAGYGTYFAFILNMKSPPYPSFSDALWLTYCALSAVGLLLLMRSRLRRFRRSMWIDAAVGGLAIAAVGAALLVDPILAATGGRVAAVATNMSYPLFDVLMISLVIAVFAMTGWRPGRTWTLFGVMFAVQGVCDMIYLYKTATGTYQGGSLLDLGWIVCMMLIALVAWQRPTLTEGNRTQGWSALMITAAFAAVGLGLTTYDHWHRLNDVAFGLATVTLLVALVRTAMTFGDMRSLSLARSQELLEHNQLILDAAGDAICGL
ncbi:MAG: hypothetical protein LC790_02125, partial [Actinobacteria bacterium]|nr:hypothetical protein [Actinomycetota bacterium]